MRWPQQFKNKSPSLEVGSELQMANIERYHSLGQPDACCRWLQGRNSLECAAAWVTRANSNKMHANNRKNESHRQTSKLMIRHGDVSERGCQPLKTGKATMTPEVWCRRGIRDLKRVSNETVKRNSQGSDVVQCLWRKNQHCCEPREPSASLPWSW